MIFAAVFRSRFYWRLREFLRRFSIRRSWLWRQATNRVASWGTGANVVRILLQRTAWIVFVDVSLVVAVQAAVNAIASQPQLHLPYLSIDLSWWAFAAGDGYRELLTLLGSVSGVVLALYFTALTTVMQASYRDVPESVRQILLRESYGNTYVSVLTTTIGAALLFIVALALDFPATRLHAVVAAIVGLVAVYSFAGLGRHAFNFFDPTRLLDTVVGDFLRLARAASTHGFQWNTPEYQQYYRRLAEDLLETAHRILELAQREPHAKTPMASLGESLVRLLVHYEAMTPKIPKNSYWYSRIATQPRWYEAPVARLELGLAARGPLLAEEVPDGWWVERRVLQMVADALHTALDARALDGAVALVDVAGRVCYALGQAWRAHEALDWLGPTTKRVHDCLAVPATAAGEQRQLVALADAISAAQLGALAGLREAARLLDLTRLADLVDEPDWHHGTRPFEASLPTAVLGGIDELRASVAFELGGDGIRRTPGWFLLERISLLLARSSQEQFSALFEPCEALLPGAIPNTSEGGQLRAALLSAQLTYCHYLRLFGNEFDAMQTKLASAHRSGDLAWPSWSAAGARSRNRTAEKHAVRAFLALAPLLRQAARDTGVPDYLGQVITRAGDESIEALLQDDDEYFRALFPALAVAAIAATEQLLQDLPQDEPMRRIHVAAGPLIDLMTISGYALVRDELTRNFACWPEARRMWPRHITGAPGRRLLQVMADAYRVDMEPLFGLTPRALLRSRWQQAIDARLRAVPRRRLRFGDSAPDHPSLLIRVVARNRLFGSFHRGAEIFVECFLRRQPEAAGTDFGKRGHLRSELEHERRRGREL